MKSLRFILNIWISLIFTWISTGQIINPYSFKTRAVKTGDRSYTLIVEGTLEPGWHLYSQHNPEGGSNPLVLQWQGAGKDYELVGPAREIGTEKAYNDIFGVTEIFWSHKIHLEQKIKLKNPGILAIRLHLEGQACKEACILVGEDLQFDLAAAKDETASPAGSTDHQTAPATGSAKNPAGKPAAGKPGTPPPHNAPSHPADTGAQKDNPLAQTETSAPGDTATPNAQTHAGNSGKPENRPREVVIEEPKHKGLWTVFFLSLLGGLIALLTPCIYPMIPLTISFFTKKHEHSIFGDEEQKAPSHGKFYAMMYGFFIVLVYVLLSLPFHLMNNVDPSIFNKISTNPWLNLAFFLIFVAFALSFMGVSRLDPQRLIPSKWISKSDEMSNKTGGLIAVFFMAITLILVSFSCTGPILGALLGSVLGSAGGAWALTVGFLGFGIGLALPFTAFALFPSMLKSMPRSGGWLNTVKVTLGFIELALAFKFLSNADLVLQLHLLEREVFLAIWIAIFFGLALYLLGMFKLPHDDDSDRIGVGRMMTGLVALAFTFYMLPGLWGAPLKWISAFPPYPSYSESPHGVGRNNECTQSGSNGASALPPGAEYHYNGLLVFRNNYDDALRYARKTGLPVMLDFTGQACVNCRKMENNVWTDPEVHRLMKDSLIVVSLYVDQDTELPADQQYVSPYTGKKITTVGEKWAEMEIYKYKSNSQPYYVLLSPGEQLLNRPKAYEPDPSAYLKWLREGIGKMKR